MTYSAARFRLAGLFLLALLPAAPLAAQEAEPPDAATEVAPVVDTPAVVAPPVPVQVPLAVPDEEQPRLPRPIGWAILVIGICGALGAFAADLLADAGRIERPQRDEGEWLLGFVGKLVIGSVASAIALSINPAEQWEALIGAALVAGLSGEAFLLAILNGQRREQAEAVLSRGSAVAVAELRGLERLALQLVEGDGSGAVPQAPRSVENYSVHTALATQWEAAEEVIRTALAVPARPSARSVASEPTQAVSDGGEAEPTWLSP